MPATRTVLATTIALPADDDSIALYTALADRARKMQHARDTLRAYEARSERTRILLEHELTCAIAAFVEARNAAGLAP